MLKISQQTVFDRIESLPEKVKEALYSEQNADILWRTCESQHIPNQKIYAVATLAGDVIMGFIHAEDLAKEIRNELNLNPAIAEAIASEIDRKIFSPIKTELEKVYSPAVASTKESSPSSAVAEQRRAPEAVQSSSSQEEVLDLRNKYKEALKPPQAQPLAPGIIKVPVSSPIEPPVLSRAEVPVVSTPAPLSASPSAELRASPSTPLGASRVEPPKFPIGNKPFDAAQGKPEAGRFETPKIIPIGAIGEQKQESPRAPASAADLSSVFKVSHIEPPAASPSTPLRASPSAVLKATHIEPPVMSRVEPTDEEPVIIHKEVQLRPLPKTKKSLGGFFDFLKREKREVKQAPVMAKVDIGGKPKEAPAANPIEPPKVRVVHYSEFATPIKQLVEAKGEKKEMREKPLTANSAIPPKINNKLEPPATNYVEPPENLPLVKTEIPKPEIPKPEIPKIKTPIESVLDLRKIAELKKPEAEKTSVEPPAAGHIEPLVINQSHIEPPKAEPAKIEPPKPNLIKPIAKPAGPDKEMIDLRTFK